MGRLNDLGLKYKTDKASEDHNFLDFYEEHLPKNPKRLLEVGTYEGASLEMWRDFYPNTVRVEALAHFPIERDLVIVMDDFMEKLDSIKPYIIPEKPRALSEGEYLQTPAERDLYEQFSSCINCLLCYAACPQYGLNSNFIGPGAMALLHRYNLDNRDSGKEQRMPLVHAEEGVFNCTAVGYCSEVCPKKVDPANAVNINKTESASDYFLRFVTPKGACK